MAWESSSPVTGSQKCNMGWGEFCRQPGRGGPRSGYQSLDRLGGLNSRKLLSQAGGQKSEREVSAGPCSLQEPQGRMPAGLCPSC